MKSLRVTILLAAIIALGTGCWTTKRVLHELKWSGQEPATGQPLPESDVTPG
ncbi:MAG: hypothetical protein QF600_04390 [Verrucomicrobiota bacterium]|nr:hypothetical protein [Verrucomicrobiota bacterium]